MAGAADGALGAAPAPRPPSQNARKHGLNAPPGPQSLKAALRVVLNDPDARLEDLGVTERDRAALRLAEAEAHLARCAAHDRAARLGPKPEKPRTEFADLADEMRQALRGDDPEWDEWVMGVVELYSFVDQMLCKYKIPLTRPETFRRYYREALARRRKALAAWLEILEAEYCACEEIPETKIGAS